MNNATQIRKNCHNCKMTAMFTNVQHDFSAYGSATYSDTLTCENCGTEELQVGTKVLKSGYEGFVTSEYMPGMYEVKLSSGGVVVPASELTVI